MVVRIPLAVEKALEMMRIFKIRSFRRKNTVESVGSADESRDVLPMLSAQVIVLLIDKPNRRAHP